MGNSDYKDAIKAKLHETYGYGENLKEVEDKSDEDKVSGKYKRLQKLLSNDIFNHAAIERKAFGNSDSTTRSLFRKKLNRYKDDSGGTYTFDEEEISKIFSVIQSIGTDIVQSVNREDKE